MTLCERNRVRCERNRSVGTGESIAGKAEALHPAARHREARKRESAWHARSVTRVGIVASRCGPSWLGDGAAPENGRKRSPAK